MEEEIKDEIDLDVDWLLANPGKDMGSKYHDAGKCWVLIDALRARLQIAWNDAKIAIHSFRVCERDAFERGWSGGYQRSISTDSPDKEEVWRAYKND